jgi:outer membrane receptor for ferrienterochelin and colicins
MRLLFFLYPEEKNFGESMLKHGLVLSALLIFSGTQGLPVYADEKSNIDLFALSMEQLLDVSVSVSNKTETKITVSPASVSLFSRQDISALGVTNLIELLHHVPGFYPAFSPVEGNQSYLVTRGHAQKYANTVLFLLNGRRINEDYTGGINYLIRHFNLTNVKRVEVIRGTGSALYGSNAFNGVVNIITGAEDYVSISAGSHGMMATDFSVNTQLGEWKLGLAGAFYQDDGQQYYDIFDRLGLQTTTQDPRDNQQLELSLQYADFSWHSFLQRFAFEDYYLFRRVSDEHNEAQLENWIHQATYQLWQQDEEHLTFSAQLQKGERQSLAMLAPQDDDEFMEADFLFGEQFSHQSIQLALDGAKRLNESWLLSSGLEWIESKLPEGYIKSNYNLYGELEWLGDVTVFNLESQRIVLDKTRYIRSAYLQTETLLTDKLTLTMGLRWDGYNDIDSKLNPRLALVYQPWTQHVFKGIYGEAYRVPSLGDLYDEESGLTQGNLSLRPSVIKSYELVYNYTGSEFFMSSTLFHNEISDLIGFDSADTVSLANIAENSASGIELEWRWNMTDSIRLRGHGTHLFENKSVVKAQASLTPSEQLSPDTYLMTILDWQINTHWQPQLQWSYRSQIDITSDPDALSLMNALLTYQPSSSHRWQLMVSNLLDKRYQVPVIQQIGSADGQAINELPTRGREVSLRYVWHF